MAFFTSFHRHFFGISSANTEEIPKKYWENITKTVDYIFIFVISKIVFTFAISKVRYRRDGRAVDCGGLENR